MRSSVSEAILRRNELTVPSTPAYVKRIQPYIFTDGSTTVGPIVSLDSIGPISYVLRDSEWTGNYCYEKFY